MDYNDYAEELLRNLIKSEQKTKLVQNNISELAKGEMAVMIYLLEENDGAIAYEISDRFEINTSRVAAILNSLCKKRYVQRIMDLEDKRKVHVHLTEEGKTYCAQKYEIVLEHTKRLLEQLGEEDAKEYVRILKKISLLPIDNNSICDIEE